MTQKKPKREHKKVGRPSVWTDDVVAKIEEVAALDGSVEEMAMLGGVSPTTVYDRLKSDAEFSERIAALRLKPFLKARRTIDRNLETVQGAQWFLEKKRRREFGNSLDLTSGNKPISALTQEQQARVDAMFEHEDND